MPRGSKLAPLVLIDEQREQLPSWSRSTSMPHGLVLRARIVPASAEGLTNTAVAKHLAISLPTVGKWRRRFLALGVQGLHDDGRLGRPRTDDDEKVATAINHALHARPADSGIWSVCRMADAEGVSKSTVQCWFGLYGVKPHLAEKFKLSKDPFITENVRDVRGLYLNPPRTMPSCSAWTKRPRYGLWTALSPPCREASATPKAISTTTSVRLRPPRHDHALRGP